MGFLGNIGKALGGGNILGMALGAASMFFPPLGLASAAMGNIFGQVVGKAVGSAVGQMIQNLGMPNSVGQMINRVVQDALGKLTQNVERHVQDAVQDVAKDWIKDFQQQFIRDIIEEVAKLRKHSNGAGHGSSAGGNVGAGGNAGAGGISDAAAGESWFVQVAIALGEAADKQMHKVKKLADDMNAAMTKAQAGADAKPGSAEANEAKKNEQEFNKLGANLNAQAKVLEMITSTMNNTIKAVGDALVATAKRQ